MKFKFFLILSLCAFSEAYLEYDSLMGNCLPSNPWITDDTTFWDINVQLVDNPSQLRVKQWSFSFRELLSDPTGVQHFMKFCESEFSGESLKFYLACQDIKQAPTSEIPILANKIYQYLTLTKHQSFNNLNIFLLFFPVNSCHLRVALKWTSMNRSKLALERS